MHYHHEEARTETLTARELLLAAFPAETAGGHTDGVFRAASRSAALGFAGLPYDAPVCSHLLSRPSLARFLKEQSGSVLLFLDGEGVPQCRTETGAVPLPPDAAEEVRAVYDRVLASPGTLNDRGELTLDLKAYPIGPHYPVNLLLGNRAGYPYPLCTTPKSALDSLGRGSFRASGGQQVLATRCVLALEENGEPANRQFYLAEDGKQIFYSADVNENVLNAHCVHSQNRTVITCETNCGLRITRTIFILPQEDGMPTAVEAQRVTVENRTDRARTLSIVMTGVFGIANPTTIANDVVFANVVIESEVVYDGEGRAAALTLHHKPAECQKEKRFAALLVNGEPMDGFCTSLPDFVGDGSLARPELVTALPNCHSRKMAPFFAMGKTFTVGAGETVTIDEFVGMLELWDEEADTSAVFDETLHNLLTRYTNPAALSETLRGVTEFWDRYPAYLVPEVGDPRFTAYVSHNLPFQVLYQTYVSRAFAWTQKSYRETGFREIQDIYASMYYLSAMGQNDLVKELLSNWVRSVFRMGYAYHDFTFRGKEPGDCSDDQLWLVQAVYRYVTLTGDTEFLRTAYPVAGEDGTRSLWETLLAILTYSGKISVGAHGLPLLDKADWNDTLRLDRVVMKGPEKEARYRRQLAEKHQPWGVPFENTLSESVMNACLLKIAADEVAELASLLGKPEDGAFAAGISADVAKSMQENAWKGDYFARCLMNDGRRYTFLGAGGDGLALEEGMPGTYFLNSYSWSILAGVATEEQIRTMLGRVNRYLRTDAGLKLCTLVDFDRLEIGVGTALYFPGDRENGGVFKHAAMMATVASLQAAKRVQDESLARELADLAFFMLSKALPYKTMENPYVLRGNPRFCTQYNNSETGEHIGPMLSGTASWLTLAVYEFLGIDVRKDAITLSPLLKPGKVEMSCTLRLADATVNVQVQGDGTRFRTDGRTVFLLDGKPASSVLPRPRDGGTHTLLIRL